jgi:HSP20 family protein
VLEDGTLIFKIVLPGFALQDVEVLVVGNQIVIKGEQAITPGQGPGFAFFTRLHRFERTLSLPPGVNADQVHARYHDGVLEISMPAPKDMAARRVPIEMK